MYRKGGVYADIKYVWRQSVLNYVGGKDFLLTKDMSDFQYYNGLLCFQPNHPSLWKCIQEAVIRISFRLMRHPLIVTGPNLLFECEQPNSRVRILQGIMY